MGLCHLLIGCHIKGHFRRGLAEDGLMKELSVSYQKQNFNLVLMQDSYHALKEEREQNRLKEDF